MCHEHLLLPNFSRVSFPAAMFQISSKPDKKWPSYARLGEIQNGGGSHLGCSAIHRFHCFSVENVTTVLRFKFHQNQTRNGRVMQDLVKSKMAAAAILDVAQIPAFMKFQ